jgi:hypothetical protein
MQALPHIAPAEVVVVTAAMLLLWLAPAVLSWADQRRRLRSVAEASRIAARAGAESLATIEQAPAREVSTLPEPVEAQEAAPTEPSRDEASGAATAAPAPAPEAPRPEESARYHFRLQDLRRVRLRDWPPSAVRNDPEQQRVWHEAEALAEDHESAVSVTVLSSPYPAQSVCLGAAGGEGSKLRLRFLLFPVLWPAHEEQALAEAIFEVDRSAGEVRSWIQARRKN